MIHHIRIFDYNETLYVIAISKYFKVEIIIDLRIGGSRTP